MPHSDATASAIQQILEEVHARFLNLRDGAPADYIPELAKADPDDFGIVIATTDGRVYEVGQTRKLFTIQSISKPFAYGLALKLLSADHMQTKVGVEPSGDAFNAISLHPVSGIPRNPMINAGAIATTAQIWAHDPERAESMLLDFLSDMAGHRLEVDEAVFRSERDTGHRNRAIGHLLRNFDVINASPEPGLQLYFRQCAVKVTCQDLAVMAATLACQGRNPRTGVVTLDPAITTNVLAVMGSCGMYDYTGQWLYNVGMPAKSGVGGGVMAVVPGRVGLAVYSPPLDSFGNSSRGIAVCEELSHRLELHLFDQPARSGTTIRSSATGKNRYSRRWRSAAEFGHLDRHGERIRVLQVQGVLDFAAVEELLSHLEASVISESFVVMDLAQVVGLPSISAGLVLNQLELLAQRGIRCLLCRGEHLEGFWPGESDTLPPDWFTSLDTALETAENLLLEKLRLEDAPNALESNTIHLLEVLPEASRAVLEPLLERRSFTKGEVVFRRGDAGQELFLIEAGCFSAGEELQPGKRIRFATFSTGVSVGEIAFLNGTPRTADMVAEEDGSCLVLQREAFDRLHEERPDLVIEILLALHGDLALKLQRANQQLSLLEQR
ncbi:glutaminase A [Synechococcus sp. CBW1002]|uniref:glutaminase A n=1 Tax=unclassified Synechococcus TaxID=2626047 RepID=UPI0018CF3EEC|nr:MULTISPECIES: glutaminase A [unclassified Synechococcus]QPN58564.1 glutaminase A [Synechococcus sp. CBW1002]QPN65304.1 glutaminase A [Synechococcus sp. CBW1006]CAK6700223.1 Glutaminase [Synechococcus sp. CBW1107]